jgi:branched-chain amino acid transport system permease protein
MARPKLRGRAQASVSQASDRKHALKETAGAGIGLVVFLVGLSIAALTLSSVSFGFQNFVLTTLINLIIVVGMYIFMGNSGVLSFGHISFMAIGAYGAALVTIPVGQKEFVLPHLPHFLVHVQIGSIPSILLGGAVAAMIGLALGVPLMRLNGIAASIATLSVLIITNVVLGQWDALTGGRTALVGVPITTTVHSALVWCVVVIVAAWLFQRTRVGLRLRASREDVLAAHGVGIGVVRERWVAFGLSAFIVGVGGGLYGHRLGGFAPNDFYFELTFIAIAMLVVGGITSLSGAIVGTLVVSSIEEFLGRLENGEGVGPIHLTLRDGVTASVLALLVLIIMIVRPDGITGGRESIFDGLRSMRIKRRKTLADALTSPVEVGDHLTSASAEISEIGSSSTPSG